MMNYSQVFCGIFCAFFLSACAATLPPAPDYFYGKGAIEVHLRSGPMLNLNQGSPHTLLICVHQFRDPNAFNRLIGDADGIYKLLECSQFDGSVTHSKRIIVQPDQKVSYILDRAEGTKFVAVCAGYYNVKKDGVVRLYEIPVVTRSLGFFRRTLVAEPDVLKIKLDLGPTQIRNFMEQ